jgi:hypothetical protein
MCLVPGSCARDRCAYARWLLLVGAHAWAESAGVSVQQLVGVEQGFQCLKHKSVHGLRSCRIGPRKSSRLRQERSKGSHGATVPACIFKSDMAWSGAQPLRLDGLQH